MIVEDNPTDVFLVREAIAAHGLEIHLHVIEDGEKAMRRIAQIDAADGEGLPHLVLLDINLPRADGFEVLRYLRSSRCCGKVPVIVMTSSGAATDQAQSAALGANAYFQKPSGYDEFLRIGEIIKTVLE
jgi:CheY-like chemotaxis protein